MNTAEHETSTEAIQVELVAAIEDATERRRLATSHDGWTFDEVSGEIVAYEPLPDRFEIVDEESADWTLELRSRIEGEILGLEARRDALVLQLNSLIGDRHRQLAWWDWRFRPGLIAFAKRCLQGTKGRTKRFAWGQVAFRNSQGTREILMMDAAVEYVREVKPELVKRVETVTIKAILEAKEAWERAIGEEEKGSLPFLLESGPQENVTITTGIETKTKGGSR